MTYQNLNYETELLESLEWDNEKLTKLFEYITQEMNASVLSHPNKIIHEINEKFSIETGKIVRKMFAEVAVRNNLHLARQDDHEH